ncbi:hypothetical protein NHJ13734_004829 [Beauveria thailandica]
MPDGFGVKLLELIGSYPDLMTASGPERRLLSGIAAPVLIWTSTHRTKEWKGLFTQKMTYLYEIGSYNGNKDTVAATLFSRAHSCDAIGAAEFFETIFNEERMKKAIKAEQDKQVNADYKAFHRAAKDGDTDEVKRLLNNLEIDGNNADASGMTPLHHAAKHGHSAVVKLLLDNPKIGRNNADERGMTPLHHAVEHCCSAVVELLVADDKVEIDMEDGQGNIPLMLAVYRRSFHNSRDGEQPYYDIMSMMLGNPKADGIHVFNHQYQTPLSWAIQTGQSRVSKLFLEHQKKLDEAATNSRTQADVTGRGR